MTDTTLEAAEADDQQRTLDDLQQRLFMQLPIGQAHLMALFDQFVAQGDANSSERGGVYQWVIRPVADIDECEGEDANVLIVGVQEDPVDAWDISDDTWGIDGI